MTEEIKDQKLKTPLSQSAVEGRVSLRADYGCAIIRPDMCVVVSCDPLTWKGRLLVYLEHAKMIGLLTGAIFFWQLSLMLVMRIGN